MDKQKKIYFDYAATTPCDPLVIKAMLPYFNKKFGNSASLHYYGQETQEALSESRKIMAGNLGVKNGKIIFTSSATESNNLALKGVAFANQNKGKQIIISSIEHDCVLESANWLEKQGWQVVRIKVNRYGLVEPSAVEKAISKNTVLVSIMHANNEIGTIEPIAEIGQICRKNKVLFHTDASQTFGKFSLNVEELNVDLLTASSHKIYGPKGAALLYVKEGVKISPILHGGGHEFGIRSSTVNVAAIVGFTKAVEIYKKLRSKEIKRIKELRDRLIKGILKRIPYTYLNGDWNKLLPNIANIRFLGVEGESVMMQLDMKGVAVSTGSACSSQTLKPSHVLVACGLKPEEIHGSVRFSLGRWTTKDEVDYVLKILPGIIKKLREISPFKFSNK